MKKNKVVLAYSGGLDTSVILKWLQVEKEYDVIAVCIDLGQKDDFESITQKALSHGAQKAYVVEVKNEFLEEYVFKGLKAGAVYEDKYLLGTAFARPLIAKKLVEVAELEGALAIAHGATGKGNDQVRFEAGIMALNPELTIVAPWREWELKSREDCIAFAQKHGIPIPVTKKDIYSRDENLWHMSIEGGELEEPWNQHDPCIYKLTTPVEEAPNVPEYIDVTFEKGVPIKLNSNAYNPVVLVSILNEIGGANGVGVIDIVENRLVGMKSRGVYETPGGTILYEAHKALEKLTVDRSTLNFKKMISTKYADLVYDGLWFSPLKMALDSFVDEMQENVSGTVKMKLYKGNCNAVASQSEYSLYNEEYVTFGEDEVYNQKDAEGFIKLFALPLKLNKIMENKKKKQDDIKTKGLKEA